MKSVSAAILSLSLSLSLICGLHGDAHASKRRSGIILTTIGAIAAVGGIAMLSTGLWARSAAPSAATLMQYNHLASVSDDLTIPGPLLMVLAAPLITFGGFSLAAAAREARPVTVGLSEGAEGAEGAAGAAGLALGWRF